MTKAIIFDFGDTLVDYPLRDNAGQIAYIVNFIEKMVATNVVSLERFEGATHFAKALNTENADQSTWPFLERVRSERFFGPALSVEAAHHLERTICQGGFFRGTGAARCPPSS